MKNITIEEQHTLLLDIAKVFHRICEKHRIPYYMLGGTMLGAVRHKGFIPWDDDMDFGVPREYFNDLINILKEEIPAPFHVLTMDNSDALVINFIKIEDTRTIINELFKEDARDSFGVNIDIFPLDKCNDNKCLFSKNYMIHILVKVQAYRFLCAKNRSGIKKAIAYTLQCTLPYLKQRTIINFIEKHLQTKGSCYANHYGAWGNKEIIPISVFGKGRLYNFENTQFFGVEESDNYLRGLYGNYMELPPEEKRHIHIVDTFWR